MSRRILRLSPEVAEKIAAGEVVERPFSVVKELVENSLDAGAARIELFVEEGGKKLIRIQDDGSGMAPEEMGLALERHATSKIRSVEDLFSISTLGFRGEALPSLAAVSKMILKSRSRESERLSGYEISLEGGKKISEHETGHPAGTTIEVRDLFFNTPARLKFLKSPETEWGHIEDYLTAMALAYPEVQFTAFHQGKEKIRFAQKGIQGRMAEVWGSDFSEAFYDLKEERGGGWRLQGFLGHPNLSRHQTGEMYVFLNRRPIKDRLLNHAIMTGYRNLLMKDQYPRLVLFLEVPPGEVDVNVHPTKREVRFTQPNTVHHLVADAVRKKLAEAPWKGGGEEKGVRSEEELFSISHFSPLTPRQSSGHAPLPLPLTPHALRLTDSKVGRLPFSSLSVIGQLKGTYVLCQTDDHFVIVDQHAAHERIGFEKLKRAHQSGPIALQTLLVPQVIELKEWERECLLPHLKEMEALGMVIEEFGPRSVCVKGLPALLGGVQVDSLIHDLIGDLAAHGKSDRLQDRLEEIFALMACHRQIRAGDRLSLIEMQQLISDLDAGAYSYHCPHGRPVMVQIPFREIEKWFKRIL